uniref:RING-type domain-containing protein n=1 Tax=Branchiostoma floridae TaxID=7739 RepID=C3XVL1_BRAFL|eukprot:XP_002612128.1 hypothetical protein BRAFLDRAFT_96076 [Branchiostoma floridae]
MARKIEVMGDFGDQFLTCSVCMLRYRDPRVLPCFHTFYKECLKLWATQQQPLECPACRTQVSLPDQGVDGLRTNFYVNKLLDFAAVKKGAGSGSVPCQVCETRRKGNGHGAYSVLFCCKRRWGSVRRTLGPTDVAVDTTGNIAVVDGKGRRVLVFDTKTGQSLRCFSLADDGEHPCGIDIDSNGQFIVTSWRGSQGIITVYSREGTLVKTLNSECFRELCGVRVLKDGRMVVVDKQLKCCLLLQPDGSLIRDIGKGQLQKPRFVAVDESRDLFYVTDGDAHKVLVFDLEGKMKFKFGEVGLGERQFLCPSGITLDPTGNVIVVNFLGGRLQVFGPDGTYLRTVPRESQRQQMVT